MESGKPFSREVPFWEGPRQASQPLTGAAWSDATLAARKRARLPETMVDFMAKNWFGTISSTVTIELFRKRKRIATK
jgi:hypothetical protein